MPSKSFGSATGIWQRPLAISLQVWQLSLASKPYGPFMSAFLSVSGVVSHCLLGKKIDELRIRLKRGAGRPQDLRQDAPPIGVNKRHPAQIQRELLRIERRRQRVPCSIELGHPGSGNPSLDHQPYRLWLIRDCDL